MRVYVDTNVPAYAAGAGDATPQMRRDSRQLLRFGMRGLIEVVASPLIFMEIVDTPSRRHRRRALQWMRTCRATRLPEEWEDEVERLAVTYRDRDAVPPSHLDDARHLAWATVAGANVLCSWNRANLVRLKTRNLTAIINGQLGYGPIGVEFPGEVLREIQET